MKFDGGKVKQKILHSNTFCHFLQKKGKSGEGERSIRAEVVEGRRTRITRIFTNLFLFGRF
ncbi:MAG: hypothetical protein ACI4AM_04805, partial [Muribaculaceae bacterium]